MSYDSTVRGELRIDPPLKWGQIRESRFYDADGIGRPGDRQPDVLLDVEREDTETEEGIVTRLHCRRVIPYQSAPYTARTLLEDVRELYEAFPGHAVRGQLVAYDEEPGQIWRVVADDAGVRKEWARLVWPDGTEVEFP